MTADECSSVLRATKSCQIISQQCRRTRLKRKRQPMRDGGELSSSAPSRRRKGGEGEMGLKSMKPKTMDLRAMGLKTMGTKRLSWGEEADEDGVEDDGVGTTELKTNEA